MRKSPKKGKDIKCEYCDNMFYVIDSLLGKKKFCSRKCKDDNQKRGVYKNCLECDTEFYASQGQMNVLGYARFCTHNCSSKYNAKDPKVKQNKRLGAIRRIEHSKGQCVPSYNKSSIPILEAKAKELGITDLQHAENGGEFKVLGYFVDGYSKKHNIVFEYDEIHHKYYQERDLTRQHEIINELNCKIIRISYNGKETIIK